VNLDLLAESVARISELVIDLRDDIKEMDVNPLVASGDRILAVDALVALDHNE
jgi:succinyl-CoA synthetase beta subunit